MTEEEYLAAEALTLARAVVHMLRDTDVPELLQARNCASKLAIRLFEEIKVETEE